MFFFYWFKVRCFLYFFGGTSSYSPPQKKNVGIFAKTDLATKELGNSSADAAKGASGGRPVALSVDKASLQNEKNTLPETPQGVH